MSSPMNGGDGTNSYTKNSSIQKNAFSAVKDAIKEALMDNLDVQKLMSGSKSFAIADYGCSVGPNTFMAMQTLIETVKNKYSLQQHDAKNLEFHVFFNDQMGNDFNTLFNSIPHPRNYFAAGVPGSFYDRLLPSSSIHVAYSSYALHWLSRLPEELVVKGSPAWNGGKIHYPGGEDAVTKAYLDQFEADMDAFLRARGEEIAAEGIAVILLPGVRGGVAQHGRDEIIGFFESILMEMVKEGALDHDEMDSFNIPCVYPGVEDVKRVIEINGCFEIVKMEIWDMVPDKEDVDAEKVLKFFRVITEKTFADHFGNEKTEQLFARAEQQKLKFMNLLQSSFIHSSTQISVVLKHK